MTFLKFFSFYIFFAFNNLSKVLSGPPYGNYVKGEIIRPSMLNFLYIFYIKILSLPVPPSCKNVCFIIVLSQRILYLFSCLVTISSLILLSKLAWFWLFSEICATSTKSRCWANYCDLIWVSSLVKLFSWLTSTTESELWLNLESFPGDLDSSSDLLLYKLLGPGDVRPCYYIVASSFRALGSGASIKTLWFLFITL